MKYGHTEYPIINYAYMYTGVGMIKTGGVRNCFDNIERCSEMVRVGSVLFCLVDCPKISELGNFYKCLSHNF